MLRAMESTNPGASTCACTSGASTCCRIQAGGCTASGKSAQCKQPSMLTSRRSACYHRNAQQQAGGQAITHMPHPVPAHRTCGTSTRTPPATLASGSASWSRVHVYLGSSSRGAELVASGTGGASGSSAVACRRATYCLGTAGLNQLWACFPPRQFAWLHAQPCRASARRLTVRRRKTWCASGCRRALQCGGSRPPAGGPRAIGPPARLKRQREWCESNS